LVKNDLSGAAIGGGAFSISSKKGETTKVVCGELKWRGLHPEQTVAYVCRWEGKDIVDIFFGKE